LAKVAEAKAADINANLSANNLDDILGRNKDKDKDKTDTDTPASTTPATTSNTTTMQTIQGLNATEKESVVNSAASTTLASASYDNIKDIPDSIKNANAKNISKSILVDNDLYSAYKKQITETNTKNPAGLSTKIDSDAKRVDDNRAFFSQDEFKSIIQRNDELARRLAPQADKSKINL
jgi:hypothetical protein